MSGPDGLRAFVEQIRNPAHCIRRDGDCALPSAARAKLVLHQIVAVDLAGCEHSAERRPVRSMFRGDPQGLSGRIASAGAVGKPLVWFDNAATTQKPQSVIDAISNYYSKDNSNIHRGAHTLAARSTDAFEQAVRDKVQKFIGRSVHVERDHFCMAAPPKASTWSPDVRPQVPAASGDEQIVLSTPGNIMPTSFRGKWSRKKRARSFA